MAESNSNKVDQVAQPKPSMQEKENPTNLLQRFSPEKATQEPKSTDSEKKAEVNLGLSLGSLYSPNSTEKLLTRSSSVAGVMTLNKEAAGGSRTTPPRAASLPSLERSSSLPAETGQRVLSVKDLQAMRRMEVKKRLAAKGAKAAQPPPEVAAWTVASAPNDGNGACRAVVKFKAEGYITYLSGPGGVAERGSTTHFEPLPVERDIKPVVTSAGMANGKHANPAENELENPSKKVKVSNGNVANGNASNGNASNGNASNGNAANGNAANGNASNGNAANGNASNGNVSDDNDSDNIWENGMEAIAKMPCVRTTGNGPNGRRIEGFLYQYLKGNVRIVCVCHGSFLSPAEFVKHAGGGEVENPMRHITVCTNPFPL